MKASATSNTLKPASTSTTKAPWQEPELEANGQELLEHIAAVKQLIKTTQATEKQLLMKLDTMLGNGALDDLRDGGEDRWIAGGMTLTRVQRRTYQYSNQTEALAMQLKEAQKAEQANGDAHCEIKESWRAVLK